MSQGFDPRRRKLDVDKAARWARFRETGEENYLPDHPDVLPLLIDALRRRIRHMARTEKDRRLAETKDRSKDDVDGMRRVASVLLRRINNLDRTAKKDLSRRIRLYIQVISQRTRYPSKAEANWIYHNGGMGHFDLLFEDELRAIADNKLINFACLPAVLRHQRDLLCGFMTRRAPDGYARDDIPETWIKRNHKRLYEELTFYGCACIYSPDLNELSKVVDVGPAPKRRHKRKKRIALPNEEDFSGYHLTYLPGESLPLLTWGPPVPYEDSSWVIKEWPFPPRKIVFKDRSELNPGIKAALESKGPGEMIPSLLSGVHSGLSGASIRQILKASSRRSKIPRFLQ